MKKALLIGWKDVRIAFRDRAALILMLAAPFVLTLGLGLVTGRFSAGGNTGGIQDIPVSIINQDEGQLGDSLVLVFTSPELESLVEPVVGGDVMAARQLVENDESAAVVVIPAGFTDSIIPQDISAPAGEAVQIELYTNPARPISSGVIVAIVNQFITQVETGQVGGTIAVTQMLQNGLIAPADIPQVAQEIGTSAADSAGNSLVILRSPDDESTAEENDPNQIDTLAILAPGMATLFLMYTVTYGGRSLLAERDDGTLPRLLSTPTAASAVLGGKTVGIFMTGLAQMMILIGGTSILFGLDWGDPLAVVAIVMATVAGATGWGILLAALARTPGQVSSVGTAMMLIFGVLGGSFVAAVAFPDFLQTLRLITPNAWALDGLAELALGGSLNDVLLEIFALLVMALILFVVSVVIFRRRGLIG